MADTTNNTSLDATRIANLAQHVRGVLASFTTARDENALARKRAQDASDSEVNVREVIITTLADYSQVQQLTENEITAIAAKVVTSENDEASQRTIQQFIGECKRAMNPKVRARVPSLIALRDLCWTSELEHKKADSTEPTPFRDAFKRKYHMMLAMFDAEASGRSLNDHPDVLAFAEYTSEVQRTNTAKVLKRLEGITKELISFHKDFPVDDISVCIDALQAVDAKALKAARPKPASNVVQLPVPTKTVAQPAKVPENLTAENLADLAADPDADESNPVDELIDELAA